MRGIRARLLAIVITVVGIAAFAYLMAGGREAEFLLNFAVLAVAALVVVYTFRKR
ncbi:MAG: hypothetical protein ACYC4L_09825 [Chloroflexota bacterium]